MAIILIGLPSSGKSTLGVLLAKSMGYKFIDADIVIQERYGRLLHEIIEEIGPDGFIELENEINQSITDTKAVIATGGSAVYGEEAMKHFKMLGTVIYIKIPFETMEKRLGDYTHRGVVLKKGMTLRDMYDERTPLYERYADITAEGLDTMHETLNSLLERLKL